jgi:type I restriction enzyme, S subunit
MEKQLIPAGYKQTEVGVIPEDWCISNLESVSIIPMQNGLFYEPKRKGRGIPLINVGDMYTSAPIDISKLDLFEATRNEIKTFKVQFGDLFFTRSSIVPSGIAYCNIFPEESKDAVFDSHLIRVRPDSALVDPKYLYLNCTAIHSRKFLISSAKTATMTTIDQGAIKKCPVLVPPLPEQTAIANALSDVDALIAALEKLINKKSAIKTAAMQQLLTGKKRLPPFDQLNTGYKQTELGEIPGDWEVKAVAELGQIMTGSTPSTNRADYYGDEYMFISPADLQGQKYITKSSKMLTAKGFSICRRYPKKSILFTCIGSTIGKCAMSVSESTSNQQINAVLPSELVDTEYLFYQLFYTAPKVKQQAGEQAVPIVNKTKFGEHLIPMSSEEEEQTAIANVLSDMDKDLEALQQRLHKTQQIKQGMMQELLTGKTRLI